MNSVLHANQERYFNCAFIARPSAGLIEDAYSAREWPEVINEAREKIALTLDPPESDRSPRSADRYVSLFANTTSALTRVLAQVQRGFADSRPTLLATDLEYPGCVAAINDCWNAPVVMARVARRLSEDIERADDHLHDALTRAFNVLKPRVVLVSHVARTTGQMLSPRTLRYFREANPRAVLIVDGSQAAGNVVVDADILDQCDFYISSGHKWLGGIPTSGFVWHAEEDRWEVDDQAQSVAFRGQQQAGGSGNAAAWASLSASLTEMAGDRPRTNLIARAKEIRHLAAVFRERLAEVPGVRFLTPTVRGRSLNGIITLTLPRDADRTLEEALRGRGYEHSTLEREQVRWRGSRATRFLLDWAPGHPVVEHATEYTETWSQRAHRFCFHYWHCEADVVALAEHVKDHVTSAAAHGPRAATQPTMP